MQQLILFTSPPPATPPMIAPRTCGRCKHYQAPRSLKGSRLWGFCTIRAAADLHPCNLPPFDAHAQQCSFYEVKA